MTETTPQYSNRNQVAQTPAMGLIAQGAVFWKPDYLVSSPWLEHLPMLFWLVEAVQPQNVVSLHLGGGAHHFAVCQAVERLRLDATCYAVSEDLSEQVFQRNENYVAFSQCIEQSAVDAIKQFSEGSIDLLLLDGSSPVIEEEVDTWVPLMSPQSVMLIVGTAKRGDGNYGRRVFESLAKKYPSLSFSHGGGVGLVAVGSSPRLLIARLLELADGAGGIQVAREVFARLGRACHDAWVVTDRESRLSELEKNLRAKEQEADTLSEQYRDTRGELESLQAKSVDFAKRIEQQVERHAHDRGSLAERVSNLQEERNTLRSEVDRLAHQLAESKRDADQKAKQFFELRLEQSQQTLELEKLRIQDGFREQQFTAVKGQLEEIKDSVLEERKRADLALNEVQVERADKERLQRELTLEINRLNQSLIAETKRSKDVEIRLKDVDARFQEAQLEKQRLEGELASSHALIHELNSRIEKHDAENEDSLKALRQHYEQQLVSAAEQNTSDQQALKEAQQRIQDLESRLEEQSSESAEKLDSIRKEHEAQLAERDAAIEQLKSASEKIKSDLEQQIIQLKSSLHDAQERAARYGSEAESLTKSLSEKKSSLQALETDLQQQKQLTSRLQSVEAQLRRELSEKYTEIAALTQMLENSTAPEGTQADDVESRPSVQTSSVSGGGWFSGNKRKKEEKRLIELIERSREFDADWYLDQYPDVARHPEFSKAPARHYLKFGGFEGRNPGPGFDSAHYLDMHPELKVSKTNPLVHFLSSR